MHTSVLLIYTLCFVYTILLFLFHVCFSLNRINNRIICFCHSTQYLFARDSSHESLTLSSLRHICPVCTCAAFLTLLFSFSSFFPAVLVPAFFVFFSLEYLSCVSRFMCTFCFFSCFPLCCVFLFHLLAPLICYSHHSFTETLCMPTHCVSSK